jgi:hypothetical protein
MESTEQPIKIGGIVNYFQGAHIAKLVISGNIDHLHVAHADVAVGVAEKGSNVYHHKTDSHE